MVEETFELTLLFDYYGDLLTQKQRSCFDLHYNQDLSLGEIAQEVGISRQGVHDTLTRAEASLRHMEAKTAVSPGIVPWTRRFPSSGPPRSSFPAIRRQRSGAGAEDSCRGKPRSDPPTLQNHPNACRAFYALLIEGVKTWHLKV